MELKSFRSFFTKLKTKTILLLFIFALAISTTAAELQVETPTGFETDLLPFRSITYAGECPGIGFIPEQLKARFKSSSTTPAPGRKVKIMNVTEGMDDEPYPYTNRKYDKGKYSERFDMSIAKKHRTRSFSVIEGDNEFKYEVSENNAIIEQDSFTAKVVINDGGVVERNQVCTSRLECDGSGENRKCRTVRSCSCS
ncbi:hypothetical protein [Argonema galeatum]|uniref:hypothetical protein n=1 Tax=Argonema galeatum TaxID=2942762 RepID=UPI002011E970|nr:hypothetical protein [Argonema galeatum]MCL1464642.1 hypothetical protein [Argonema galeatum A003/A1]